MIMAGVVAKSQHRPAGIKSLADHVNCFVILIGILVIPMLVITTIIHFHFHLSK